MRREKSRCGIASAKAAFAVFAALLAAGVARGASYSVYWYSFDEHDPGWVPSTSDPIVMTNTYGTGSVNASPYATTAANKGATPADYMPRYTTPFQGMRIYDPIEGRTRINRSALRFKTAAENGGTGSYYGGTLVIPRGDRGTGTMTVDAVTVECLVCTTGGVFDTFSPIFGMRNGTDWAHEAWALYMTSNGKLEVRLRTVGSGYNAYVSGTTGSGTKTINDGNWHHVAMTYGKADGKCHVYVDYEESFVYSVPSGADDPISLVSGDEEQTSLYIGGYVYYNNKGRKFDGCIDELRITMAALTTAQFLRIEPQDRDELLRLRMDPHGYYGTELDGTANYSTIYYNHNYTYAFRSDVLQALYTDCGGTASLDDGQSYAASICDGVFGAAAADYGSLSLATNSAGQSGYMKATGLTTRMTGGNVETNMDYTVEAFFKTRTTETAYGPRTVYALGTWPVAGVVLNNTSEGRVCFTWNDGKSWRGTYSTETTANDGNWHHVATVCDTARKQMRFYYDGKLTAVSNNVNNVIQTGSSLFVGANTSGGNNFDGWIDDVRVTMRALSPGEFLVTNGVVADAVAPDTIMLTDFEKDAWGMWNNKYQNLGYSTSPYYELTRAVSLVTHGTNDQVDAEGVPAPSTFKPVTVGRSGFFNFLSEDAPKYSRGSKCSKVDNGVYDSILAWKELSLYEQGEFTVEFFACINDIKEGARPICYANATNVNEDGVWGLYWNAADSRLDLRVLMVKDGVSETNDVAHWDFAMADGQWHHYAFTLAPHDGTNTVVELFRDYETLGAQELEGLIDYAAERGGRLTIGGGINSDALLFGSVDAVRFSKGVLTPDKFIRRKPAGLMAIATGGGGE